MIRPGDGGHGTCFVVPPVAVPAPLVGQNVVSPRSDVRTVPSNEDVRNQVHYRIIDERTQPKLDAHNPHSDPSSVQGNPRDPFAPIGEAADQQGGTQSNLAGDEVELVPSPKTARAKASQRMLASADSNTAQQRVGHNVTIAMPVMGGSRLNGLLNESRIRAKMSLQKARVTGTPY